MKTYLDCIPCFFTQALNAARLAGADAAVQKDILDRVAAAMPAFSLTETPPAMGKVIHDIIKVAVGSADPYRAVKDESNRYALSLYPAMEKAVLESDDPLMTALTVAIAGNIIDYGAPSGLNIRAELDRALDTGFAVCDYPPFAARAKGARSLLYLGDNAGEVVFDRLLIEELRRDVLPKDAAVTFAVREAPIINDATVEDARACGIDGIATLISSGCEAPGTILGECTERFRELFKRADMIISKGQGNFESIDAGDRPVFFLLRAKCPVVAEHLGCGVGDMILKAPG